MEVVKAKHTGHFKPPRIYYPTLSKKKHLYKTLLS